MCGITGVISKAGVNRKELVHSVELLKHRGPDGNGIYIALDATVGFGHSRLSFIEISDAGTQPLRNKDESLVITFNGEIYNYKELRLEMKALGVSFMTSTDTEVILNGYQLWGSEVLSRLKGMFAFAIHDVKNNTVFMARDRFGIKPFYYTLQHGMFVFGSEMKALFAFSKLERKIRKESVATFLANRYVPTPNTIWEHIFQLPPASYLFLDTENLDFKISKYWTLDVEEKSGNSIEIEGEIERLLQDSVNQHLISDVQIGSFLSGGMDSSLLVSMMKDANYQPIDAFTIGFENWNQSEHFYARKVAGELGINLHEQMEASFTLDSVSLLMYHYDNPIADISILPTFSVSKLARSKVKAVLSGEGADECFGGYWWQKPELFTYENRFQRWKAKLFGQNFQQIKFHYIQAASMGLFDVQELKKAFTEVWQEAIPEDPFVQIDQFERKGISTLKQIQFLDLNLFMPELILAKIDRATMANSLEARVPFLDHELVERLFSLKKEIYFDPKIQKKILRKFLIGKVPSEVYERKKQGFVGPDLFYQNIEVYSQKLMNGRLVMDGVIKSSYIQNLVHENDHWRLWKLFVLENWWERWL